MSRNFEGRIAKLEASAVGKGAMILAESREDETKEEFDRRVDALVREAKARGAGDVFVLKIILGHRESTESQR